MANLRGGSSSDDELADQSRPHSSSFSADVARGTDVTDSATGAGSVHYGSGDQQQFVADLVPVSAGDVGSLAPPVDAIQQWGHDVVWLFSDEQQENANAFEERPYKFNSDVGNLFVGFTCRKGMKPNAPSCSNQDDLFMAASLGGPERQVEWALLGVVDGHGPFGHDVARKVAHSIPQHCLLSRQLLKPLPEADVALQESFQLAQRDLTSQEFVEKAHMSGTAATAVFVLPILASEADAATGERRQKKRVLTKKSSTMCGGAGGAGAGGPVELGVPICPRPRDADLVHIVLTIL